MARRAWGVLLGCALTAASVPACSASSGGRVSLQLYDSPDPSGATAQAAATCSTPQYTITYNKLPNAADGQRQELVRRLAAHDSGMDLMALDVTWEAEFAEAKWIVPWTGAGWRDDG